MEFHEQNLAESDSLNMVLDEAPASQDFLDADLEGGNDARSPSEESAYTDAST